MSKGFTMHEGKAQQTAIAVVETKDYLGLYKQSVGILSWTRSDFSHVVLRKVVRLGDRCNMVREGYLLITRHPGSS